MLPSGLASPPPDGAENPAAYSLVAAGGDGQRLLPAAASDSQSLSRKDWIEYLQEGQQRQGSNASAA
jgi:hypothetical protein